MKAICKVCWILCGLLLLWSAADFYWYAVAGYHSASYYAGESFLWQLIHHSIFQGITKLLLAALLAWLGYRFRKKEGRLSSLSAVTGILSITVLAIWGISMYCLTSVTAENATARYKTDFGGFASTFSSHSFEEQRTETAAKYKNYGIYQLWKAVDLGCEPSISYASTVQTVEGGLIGLSRKDKVNCAAAIYDAEGELLACSWEDFFYFSYMTEKQWENGEESYTGNVKYARALFDREKLTDTGRQFVDDSSLFFEVAALRFTGSFDGVEITPMRIEYIDEEELRTEIHSHEINQYTISGAVQEYDLPWHLLYEGPEATAEGEPVTLYSDMFDVCYNHPSPAFFYNGTVYNTVDSLAAQKGPEFLAGTWENQSHYEGLDLLIWGSNASFPVLDEESLNPPVEPEYPMPLSAISIVYCSPWRTAREELRSVYFITFLLAAALVLLARSVIKRNLIGTARLVGEAMEKGLEESEWRPEESQGWRDSQLLKEGFIKCRDAFQKQKNEITRLNTALEYAKKAEEDRRQMTSNIAHELKTPLAIIHSYAEGLKEHTAEEKREKYIDVILSEAERTDSMVLEMLDLSRLEAGRVKLSRDDFSLVSLTQSIFDKLEIAVQDKELQIEFSFPDDFTVTADESRIAQVVENFATNAIKYTPAGGRVKVKIETERGKTLFSIENEASPLSYEALTKVWEAFYRTDEARSGEGSGLGLAIAKSIIELHGGKCWVHNTEMGVEFGFTF